MKHSKEYHQIWQNIYDIRKEVLKNKKRIEIGRLEMQNASQLIPQKKEIVLMLKKKLEQLQEQNQPYHQTKLQKIKYGEQADQLYQLAVYFQEDNKQYNDSNEDVEGFSRDKQLEVGMKLEDVITQINAEFTDFTDDYFQEQNRLNEINASLDREIKLLKLLRPDIAYRYSDNFDIVIDEFSDRFIPEEIPEFRSFNSLQINQNNDQEIQIKRIDSEISYPPPLSISEMQGEIINVIKDCKLKSKYIKNEYLIQHQELNKMIEALKNRPVNFCDKASIENYLQRQLQNKRATSCIKPIQLPSTFSEKSSQIKILNDVFYKFDLFFNEIKKYQEKNHFNQQPQLEIPPFRIPKEPKCTKCSIPSNDLIKFAEDLKSIMEQTKQMIPIEYNNSITQSYRSLLSLKRKEMNSATPESELINTSKSKEKVENEIPEFDKTSFDRFKETFSRKLPENPNSPLDAKRFSLEIPDFEQTDTDNKPQNTGANKFYEIPKDTNNNFLNRVKATNMILRELANKTKTDVPRVHIPKPPEINQPKIDSNSLIEKALEVLSPNQQSIHYLKNEINFLSHKIDEVSNKLLDLFNEGYDEEDSDSQNSINAEIKKLSQEIDSVRETYNELQSERRDQYKKREEIKNDIQSLKQIINANQITQEDVDKIRTEYETRRDNLQKEKEDFEESQNLLNMLRNQS